MAKSTKVSLLLDLLAPSLYSLIYGSFVSISTTAEPVIAIKYMLTCDY